MLYLVVGRMKKKKDNTSFWNTLPGILTGIAGIVGAIAALFAIIPGQPP